MQEEIPYIISEKDCPRKKAIKFPIANLMDEIASDKNIESSFDYVVSHLENADQREHIRPKKAAYCKRLKQLLSSGQFRITPEDIRELTVTDGPKVRVVQCPTVFHRDGCHAVMVPFEKYTYTTLITNTAASIKGRGMHWLHDVLERDLVADPDGTKYYYQCDIHHFYDSISQEIMMRQVREYTSDPLLLPIMDNFITLLPQGLSKGLRASQCLANLHLNDVDHEMCKIVKYYYRYCDDIVILAATKKECWAARNRLVELLGELGLRVKPSEAVRPTSEGVDFLGYVTYPAELTQTKNCGEVLLPYSRIRKRTKKKFARRIGEVKSRKRRQSLIGSFFGMAAHADCKHLMKTLLTQEEYRKLKHKRKMKEFGNFKVKPPTLDGKKNFKGDKVTSVELDHKGVIVVDFERDVVPRREREDYNRRVQAASAQGIDPQHIEKPKTKYILSLILDGRLRKLWTGDREIWQILDQVEAADGLPFFVGIVIDYSGQYKKLNFVPAAHLNLQVPTDAELDQLLTRLNLKQ